MDIIFNMSECFFVQCFKKVCHQNMFESFYFTNERSSLYAVQKRHYLPRTPTIPEVNRGQKLDVISGNQRSTSGQPAFNQRSRVPDSPMYFTLCHGWEFENPYDKSYGKNTFPHRSPPMGQHVLFMSHYIC